MLATIYATLAHTHLYKHNDNLVHPNSKAKVHSVIATIRCGGDAVLAKPSSSTRGYEMPGQSPWLLGMINPEMI
jgi:hypothetical protein